MSGRHAVPMGKTAGHNAAADLLGVPPVDDAEAILAHAGMVTTPVPF